MLGTWIVRGRRAAGCKQRDLARQLGVSAQYLSDIERGRRQPDNPVLLEHLARALNMPADVLYFAAGRLPPECAIITPDQTTILTAFRALRTVLALPHRNPGGEM